MLCGMYKNAEQTQLIQILFQGGKRKRSKWLWKRVRCWGTDGRSFSHKDCSAGSIGTSMGTAMGRKLWSTARIWWSRCSCISVICKEKQKSSSSSGDWECQYRMWSDCQQEQSIDSYTERDEEIYISPYTISCLHYIEVLHILYYTSITSL